jgi:hypothetical protein
MRLSVRAALLLVIQTTDAVANRILKHMAQTLAVQPNYICLETAKRRVTPINRKRTLQDSVRFAVALVDGKKMFSCCRAVWLTPAILLSRCTNYSTEIAQPSRCLLRSKS